MACKKSPLQNHSFQRAVLVGSILLPSLWGCSSVIPVPGCVCLMSWNLSCVRGEAVSLTALHLFSFLFLDFFSCVPVVLTDLRSQASSVTCHSATSPRFGSSQLHWSFNETPVTETKRWNEKQRRCFPALFQRGEV